MKNLGKMQLLTHLTTDSISMSQKGCSVRVIAGGAVFIKKAVETVFGGTIEAPMHVA